MNRYTFLGLLALVVLVMVIPFYAFQEQNRLLNAQADLQEQYVQNGSALYLEFCAGCHGPDGEGVGLNPALNRLGMSQADPDTLFQIIARATHGSAMASWHLSEGGIFNDYQIRELVTLIRYGDWVKVNAMAQEQGLEFDSLPTVKVEDISTSMLTETDPHQCIACHEEPKVHTGDFGLDCVRCHSLTAWNPASLTRHTFRLDHGDQGEVACETCHIAKYTENTCYECHEHTPEDVKDVHEGEGIFDYENCIACHPTGKKGEGRQNWQKLIDQATGQRSYME